LRRRTTGPARLRRDAQAGRRPGPRRMARRAARLPEAGRRLRDFQKLVADYAEARPLTAFLAYRSGSRRLQRLKGWGLRYGGSGPSVSPVWARKPSMSSGRYWMRLSRVLTVAASWSTPQAIKLPRSRFR